LCIKLSETVIHIGFKLTKADLEELARCGIEHIDEIHQAVGRAEHKAGRTARKNVDERGAGRESEGGHGAEVPDIEEFYERVRIGAPKTRCVVLNATSPR
jgi:hypothetical protein